MVIFHCYVSSPEGITFYPSTSGASLLAGAGMGVDSGLPDFRGSTGLFKDRSVAMSYEAAAGDPQNPWGFGRSWPLSSI